MSGITTTVVKVVASEKLADEVKKELEIADPEQAVGQSILKEGKHEGKNNSQS